MSEINIPANATKTLDFEVTKERTAVHIGSGSVSVLSTPSMILLMEIASGTVTNEYLPKGYSTVGTRVCVDHVGAVLEGNYVQATSTVKEVENRKVTYEVEVKFGNKLIGKGIHIRHIVNEKRFLDKLKD